MIINIRGGCGAGKSTLVKRIINDVGVQDTIYAVGRRKPMGYVLTNKTFVPGHYEIQNGGLDTIFDIREAYAWIDKYRVTGHRVLYEGANQKRDVPRIVGLATRCEVHVITLNTSYDECLASFRAKGQRRDEKYVETTHRKANRDAVELQMSGIDAKMLNRAGALAEVRRLLGC